MDIVGTFAKDSRSWRALLLRFVSPSGGTKVQLAVTNGATTVTYTFPYPDADTTYGVVATPNWSTTVYCSSRSVTSLTLTFGTAAPASATVDIITFRS